MGNYVQIYDGEFSGGNRQKADILSLAGIIIDLDNLSVVDTFMEYGCPRDFSHWNMRAQETHGITKTAARRFQPQFDLAVKLLKFLEPYKNEDDSPIPMVIHAGNYVDYDFIMAMFDKVNIRGSIEKVMSKDVLVRTPFIFREYLKRNGLNSKKIGLEVMAKTFDLHLDHHEAMSDTKACAEGFVKMIKYFKKEGWHSTGLNDFTVFKRLMNNSLCQKP